MGFSRSLRQGLAIVLLATGVAASAQAQNVNRPFPQHTTYAAGSVKPSHKPQDQLDAATTAFYDQWKARYLKQGCGEGKYYVALRPDGETSPSEVYGTLITVSEGMGYGLLITAFMAGHDPEAQTLFDGLYRFARTYPTPRSPYLMGWSVAEGCTVPDEPYWGFNAATDGDLDIAYALLLADKQWGSTGAINYKDEALKTIRAIRSWLVNVNTGQIYLGEQGAGIDASERDRGTRLSDFLFDHFRAYRRATNGRNWLNVVDVNYRMVERLQTVYARNTGLVPDFADNFGPNIRPAAPNFLEKAEDGQYNYNACRFPWRVGLDFLLNGERRAKTAVQRINVWIKGATGRDPSRIVDGYTLAGQGRTGGYNALAFLGPMVVGAMVDRANQGWLNKGWDQLIANGAEQDYYADTLKMLSLIAVSGNWWKP